jgi:hypothetical protein
MSRPHSRGFDTSNAGRREFPDHPGAGAVWTSARVLLNDWLGMSSCGERSPQPLAAGTTVFGSAGHVEGEGSCIGTRPAADGVLLERVAVLITAIAADDECERMLQSRALAVCGDLLRQRWLIIEQQCNLVHPPLVILIAAWTSVLFTGFGYLSPQNAVCVLALLASAASVAGAVVLILDLIRPFSGFIRVPCRPMRQALEFLRLPEPPKFRETGATLTVDHRAEAVSQP